MHASHRRTVRLSGLLVLSVLVSWGCDSDDDDEPGVVAAPGVDADAEPTGGVLDFEDLLENAFLDEQDNWRDQIGGGQAVVSIDGTPVNGTRVVEPLLETALNAPAIISRRNDDAFSFPAFTSSDGGHYLQFDLTGEGTALMALGHDADADGVLSPAAGETGPRFGIVDGTFRLHVADDDRVLQAAMNPGDATSDWYRLRLQLGVDGAGGLSTGSVLYRNLTDRHAEFRPIGGLQDIDLQLGETDRPVAPERWDTLFIHLQSDGGRTPDVDNLLPHGSPADPAG